MSQEQKLNFYATPPHDCNYLPDRAAITLFADPHFKKNTRLYSALADCGFRRSGEHLYTPHCDNCSSCVPVRIPVNEFKPSRNQKRTWKLNRNLTINRLDAVFNVEHYSLYEKYLLSRHTGGGMDNPTPDSYMQFLTASWAKTVFYEMRLDNTLVAVAIVDIMENALSAVYTFFDPDYSQLSLGRFAVLYQIEEAKKQELSSLYLGYWIENCKKMSYKDEYQPLEYYRNNDWFKELF
ncbi:MAG: arginyltransferase [Gammaproteobacteria bacterium]|jgi:leucyl-tRNA---protein transferase|nr:arginyltransferase [Gammaproteobacteria bacterium]